MLKGCFNCIDKHDCELSSQCIHVTPDQLDLWSPTTELFYMLEKKVEKLECTIKHLERRIKEEKEIYDMTLESLLEEKEHE